MPRHTSSTDTLIQQITGLFRASGYEGTSLSDISAATGLQRSSLYHRFPGGKQQMAEEVAIALGARFAAEVLDTGPDPLEPRVQIELIARNLDSFYDGGRSHCLLEMLSTGHVGPAAGAALARAYRHWRDALAAIARRSGVAPREARRRAEDAIAAIEGALIVSRLGDDPAPFRRVVAHLPGALLA